MDIEITLKNYRCFSDAFPARFRVRNGFVAFVGVNNAGKSSILKFFYEYRNMFLVLSGAHISLNSALTVPFSFTMVAPFVKDGYEVFCDENNRDIIIEIRFIEPPPIDTASDLPVPNKIIIRHSRINLQATASIFVLDQPVDEEKKRDFAEYVLRVDGQPFADYSGIASIFKSLANTLYIGPFRNVVNAVNGQLPYYDIQIGQNLIGQWRDYRNGDVKAQNKIAAHLTTAIRDIFNFKNLSIEPSASNTDLKIHIDDKSYSLSELGSGIAQFIIILFNAAIQSRDFILIDEPELNLHPKLQMEFLTTLATYAQTGLMFATHNLGLARASSDLIYSVQVADDNARKVTPLESIPNLSEFLGELSFSGYQELGFTKLLLVEGSSEVITVQQLLRKFKKDH